MSSSPYLNRNKQFKCQRTSCSFENAEFNRTHVESFNAQCISFYKILGQGQGYCNVFITTNLSNLSKRFSVAKATLQPPMSVRPSVCQSVNKTPKQLKINHFTLPQHSPLTPSHTTSQHHITTSLITLQHYF